MANTSSYGPTEMIDCDFLCMKSFAIAVVARGRGAGSGTMVKSGDVGDGQPAPRAQRTFSGKSLMKQGH